jgi:hypothetical protein
LAVGEIREVFEAPFPVLEAFETAPDGRFLMIQIGEEHPREINIVLNWFTELLERVPVP